MPANPDITFGDTYFIVARIQVVAFGDDVFSMVIYDETEAVPTTEPTT